MKLSDFASVLQLGVGVHLGTAYLQSIVEFTSSPLLDRINRLARLAALRRARLEKQGQGVAAQSLELEEEVLDLQTTLELRRVQFFNEYIIAALANTIAAFVVFGLLVWAAVRADDAVNGCTASLLVAVSFAPATISLGVLWRRWHVNTADVRTSTASIERKLLG